MTSALTPSSEQETTIELRIEKVWIALGSLFNERFTGRYPTDQSRHAGKKMWAWTLRDLLDEQIRHGLKLCKDWRKDFAPNPVQFRELCLCKHVNKKHDEIAQEKPRMDDNSYIPHLVNEGARACEMIKKIYYPNEKWVKVNRKIADDLVNFKKSFRSNMPNESERNILKAVNKMLREELDHDE